MKNYGFLNAFVEGLSETASHNYILPPGMLEENLIRQSDQLQLSLPDELVNFYAVTYAPRLDEYQFFTLREISKNIERSKAVYRGSWNNSFLPVALLLGVGDLIVLNQEKKSKEECQILDGFHELHPDEWRGICFGLENWLRLMTRNQFKPFWY